MTLKAQEQSGFGIIKALLIITAVFAVYIQAFGGGFIWDDQIFIVENRFLLDLDGLWSIWFTTDMSSQYYPLASSIFWIERHIFGLNPVGYHALNITFHSLNALLVWTLCTRLNIRGAFVIALFFALHPVHVDSVAFVNELKNLVSALFYLFALLCFLSFEDTGKKHWYALTLIAFILALFSKTIAGTLPAALLILRWMRYRDINFNYITKLVPFFVISILFAFVTITQEIENTGVNIGLSFFERVLVAGRGSLFYVLKLIYPANLSFIYTRMEPNTTNIYEWAYPLGVIAVFIVLLLFNRKLSRAPAAAVALFLVTIFPALGFVDINFFNFSYVADHFQYLASLSIIALIVAVACRLIEKLPAPTAYIAATVTVSLLALLTWNRAGMSANHEALWRDTIKKNPASWVAHNSLGSILFARGSVKESIDEFQQSIRLNPGNEKARNNLGNALTEAGHFDKAITQYRVALSITPDNALTLTNLGINYTLQGNFDEAVINFERSIEINPYDSNAFYNYALALTRLARDAGAERAYLKAIELNPEETNSRNNLANIYMDKNNLERAERLYNEVVEIIPEHARALNNLGIIMSLKKEDEKALTYFERAVKAGADYDDAHFNMAITLEDLGRPTQAKERYRIVLKLNPSYAESNNNIGSILLTEGDYAGAIKHFKAALGLVPSNTIYKKNLEIAEMLSKRTHKRGEADH